MMSPPLNPPAFRQCRPGLVCRPGVIAIAAMSLFVAPAASLELISVEQEIQIGKQAQAQMRKDVPALHDASVGAYINDVAKRLVRVAPGPKYPYSFTVADTREINAFALPGGS